MPCIGMRRLQGSGGGQLALELVRAEALDVAVAADVLLGDEDVGHAPLVGELLKGVLDSSTIVCENRLASIIAVSILCFALPPLPIQRSRPSAT